MKILYVADVNSPIAQNWIRYFVRQGDEIEIISAHRPLENTLPIKIHHVALLASFFFQFSTTQMSRAKNSSPARKFTANVLRPLNRQLGLQTKWQSYIAPLDVLRNRARVQAIADTFKPDLIHGLRIPPEGYAAAQIKNAPRVLSIWGNDLTFHAKQSLLAQRFTRTTLQRAKGLHADCARDITLARKYGFAKSNPSLVIPTAGGIQPRVIAAKAAEQWRQQLEIPAHAPIVINPRGTRAYVCVQEFFESLPCILNALPDAIFICPSTRDHPRVNASVKKLGIENSVRLLPVVSQDELATLFKLADVMVSPTTHDGVPNTLLEALAQDAFPVASDLESIREWIVDGENGLLVDATDSDLLAQAIIHALQNSELRERAQPINRAKIRARADYETCMANARAFYANVIARARHAQTT